MGSLYHVSKLKENLWGHHEAWRSYHIGLDVLQRNFYLHLQEVFIYKWYVMVSNVFESLIWSIRSMIWGKQLGELKFKHFSWAHFLLLMNWSWGPHKTPWRIGFISWCIMQVLWIIGCFANWKDTLVFPSWFFSDSTTI